MGWFDGVSSVLIGVAVAAVGSIAAVLSRGALSTVIELPPASAVIS